MLTNWPHTAYNLGIRDYIRDGYVRVQAALLLGFQLEKFVALYKLSLPARKKTEKSKVCLDVQKRLGRPEFILNTFLTQACGNRPHTLSLTED
jgi:hypothetical protein